jgi:hypothetical protein
VRTLGEKPDTPEQDAARRAVSQRSFLRLVIDALNRVRMLPGHPDKRRLRRLTQTDLTVITDEQIHALHRLAWRYRRQMPHGLVPKANPDDPIVRELATREMETTHGR